MAEVADKAIYGADGISPKEQGRAATSPADVIAQMEEAVAFAKDRLNADNPPPAPDWRKALKVNPTKWSEIVHLVDEPIPYIIWPLVVRGSMTQVQGLPKGGKSAFSLYLSICAATGIWNQPQHLRADAPLKVMYIAWEDPKIMMAKRLSLYAVGMDLKKGFHSDNIDFLFGPDIFVDQQAGEYHLREAIKELKPDVVFIDTLSHIHACDENAASEMKVPMKNLDRIAKEENVGIVYLHHTNKGGDKDRAAQDKGRGSGAIAAAWHILVDWGKREEGSNVNPIEVQSKFEHEWIKWAITYDPQKDEFGNVEKVKWEITTQDVVEEKVGAVATKINKVLESIRRLSLSNPPEGWVTAHQVANAASLGLDSKSIKRHLTQLCENGFVEFRESEKGGAPNMYRAVPKGNLQ
jgi:hypothetical protein